MSHIPDQPETVVVRWCGLLARKSLWMPSWRGWLLLLAALPIAIFVAMRGVHPFLAPDQPVGAEILVIEAWVPNYALKEGMELAKARNCRIVLLAGGLVRGEPEPEPGDTYPQVAAERLQQLGESLNRVRVVESSAPIRDRTYASAVAVRDWMASEGEHPGKVDVLTVGTHARRSRLLFQEAMGPDVEVGVISIRNREYDPAHWWRYSEGVKDVISEGAAYLYARFLFRTGGVIFSKFI